MLPLRFAWSAPIGDAAPRPAAGPMALELVLPAGRSGTAEPILATGEVGRGDTFLVYYESPARLRFGWDSSSAGIVFSPPVEVAGAGTHRLLVSMGSLLPARVGDSPDQPSAAELLRAQLLVEFDGRTVWRAPGEFQTVSGPRTVTVGSNRIGSATVRPFFTGRIIAAAPVPPVRALAEIMQVGRWMAGQIGETARYPGAVRLRLRFPREPQAAADPLIVTGRTGKGDFLYVQVIDSHHLHFGFDHWGVGGLRSPAVEADLAAPHEVVLTMDALYAPTQSAAGPWRGQVAIWLDGRRVLEGASPCHPATPEEIVLAYNLIGGSTTGLAFRGSIAGVEAVGPAELGRPGP
jgi:hypothetical protein